MKGASSKLEASGRSDKGSLIFGTPAPWTTATLTLALLLPCAAQASTVPVSSGTLALPSATASTNSYAASPTEDSAGLPTITGSSTFSLEPQGSQNQLVSSSTWSGDPLVQYEHSQDPAYGPPIGSISDYTQGDDEGTINPLGISIRQDARKLASGTDASGLLVVSVNKNSPAAKAGLKSYSHTAKSVVEGAAMVVALVFPPAIPAMALLPLLEQSQVGEDYDLIIGVDGMRVTDLPAMEDSLRDTQPGETVYLSIIHDGTREQVSIPIPAVH